MLADAHVPAGGRAPVADHVPRDMVWLFRPQVTTIPEVMETAGDITYVVGK
jgi:hypothetical protein